MGRHKKGRGKVNIIAVRIMREFRQSNGISQEQLANVLGITQSELSKIENGSVTPSLDHWAKFCDHAKIDMNAVKAPVEIFESLEEE